MVKVEEEVVAGKFGQAVYKLIPVGKNKVERKFDRLRVVIGDRIFDPSPIKFMRISELEKLDEMLQAAYEMGENGF